MSSGGNNFNYLTKNKLTKLANLVQFIRMLNMFCLETGRLGARPLGPPWLHHWQALDLIITLTKSIKLFFLKLK